MFSLASRSAVLADDNCRSDSIFGARKLAKSRLLEMPPEAFPSLRLRDLSRSFTTW